MGVFLSLLAVIFGVLTGVLIKKARLGYQYRHHFILPVPILASDFIPLRHLSSWP
jgi:hypothetical protein